MRNDKIYIHKAKQKARAFDLGKHKAKELPWAPLTVKQNLPTPKSVLGTEAPLSSPATPLPKVEEAPPSLGNTPL